MDELIDTTEKRIKANRLYEKRPVRISKRKTGYQYYWENPDGKRVYVQTHDLELVKKKVQMDYDLALKDKLLSIRFLMAKFLKLYNIDEITGVYDNMCEARKMLVTPLVKTDEDYVKEWKAAHVGSQNPFPEERQFTTESGEKVRSKSEKILADLFLKYGIPYVYEPRLELQDGITVYPDFVLLNVSKRKTIYWEHFGLISDEEYAIKTLKKISLYEKSGIPVGDELLFSMESPSMPLDVSMIEEKIKEYLL